MTTPRVCQSDWRAGPSTSSSSPRCAAATTSPRSQRKHDRLCKLGKLCSLCNRGSRHGRARRAGHRLLRFPCRTDGTLRGSRRHFLITERDSLRRYVVHRRDVRRRHRRADAPPTSENVNPAAPNAGAAALVIRFCLETCFTRGIVAFSIPCKICSSPATRNPTLRRCTLQDRSGVASRGIAVVPGSCS